MYLSPKDSNAMVGVCKRATGKALERSDIQTTDFTCIIVTCGGLRRCHCVFTMLSHDQGE